MSLTRHELDLQIAFEEDVAEGLCLAEVRRYQEMLERGTCPAWLAGFLAQGGSRWTIYDGYALRLLAGWWFGGLVAFVHVRVGVGPVADRMVDENNARLASLPDGFRVEFAPMVGSAYCDDGRFEWTRPLRLDTHGADGERAFYLSEPWALPLEVGRTTASRTLLHIIQDGGLARWPYGSPRITACRATEKGRAAFIPRLPSCPEPGPVEPHPDPVVAALVRAINPTLYGAAGGGR